MTDIVEKLKAIAEDGDLSACDSNTVAFAAAEIIRMRGSIGAPQPDNRYLKDKIRSAVWRATSDTLNGNANGDIIVKGCVAAGYHDPEDAANRFIDGIVAEVLGTLLEHRGVTSPALENRKARLADATNNPVPLTLSDARSDAEGRG